MYRRYSTVYTEGAIVNLDIALDALRKHADANGWDDPKYDLAEFYLYEVISGREDKHPDGLTETEIAEISKIAHDYILAD